MKQRHHQIFIRMLHSDSFFETAHCHIILHRFTESSAGPSRKKRSFPLTSVLHNSLYPELYSCYDRDVTKTGVRGPVRSELRGLSQSVIARDIPEANSGWEQVEVTSERVGTQEIVELSLAVIALTERLAELVRDNTRLRGTVRVGRSLRRKMPNTRSGASMTHEEVEELVTRRVAEEMEAREAARTLEPLYENGDEQEGENGGNGNGGNGGNRNGGNEENRNGNRNGNHGMNYGGFLPVARECTFQDFLKCKPYKFLGTEGVIKVKLASEKIKVLHNCNKPVYRKLLYHVSQFALKEICKQYEKITKGTMAPCTGHFTATMGLPCAHKILSRKGRPPKAKKKKGTTSTARNPSRFEYVESVQKHDPSSSSSVVQRRNEETNVVSYIRHENNMIDLNLYPDFPTPSNVLLVAYTANSVPSPYLYLAQPVGPVHTFMQPVHTLTPPPVSITRWPNLQWPIRQQHSPPMQPYMVIRFSVKQPNSPLNRPQQAQPDPAGSSINTAQATMLPHAFNTGKLHDPVTSAWNMNTGASSYLNNSVNSLSEIFNTCMNPSISFVLDNNCTIEFDAFGFSVKDFMTRRVHLMRQHGGLLTLSRSTPIPHVFLISQHTWHQRLGHPGREVLRHLVSNNFISYNKEKPPVLCHACQLGKHVRLPFVSSNTVVTSRFDLIHSDVWTLPIPSLSGFKYYFVLFRTYVRTKSKCEIRSFQCDHSGEFDNRNLHKLFADNGIQFRFSCSKTSQQNGKSERMVATRLVLIANGSTQLEGVDVDDTFSPVVKPGTIRTVLSLTASRHWPIHQLDVKNYMRSLYGLKQALRAWFQRFASYITRAGFSHSRCDSSLFIFRYGTDTAYLLLYMDDIVLTASSKGLLLAIISSLHQEFAMTDLGPINYISSGLAGNAVLMFAVISSSITYVVHILMRIGLGVLLLGDRLQGIVYFLATTCFLSPLSASRRFLILVQGFSIVVLLMLLLRLIGCAIYCQSGQHQRTKHIEIDIHFVRDLVAAGQVRVLDVPSRYQFADILTKG
ncbi:ribonuclease H-like domain-containing protein [Tanacetum coccineum]